MLTPAVFPIRSLALRIGPLLRVTIINCGDFTVVSDAEAITTNGTPRMTAFASGIGVVTEMSSEPPSTALAAALPLLKFSSSTGKPALLKNP